MPQKRSYLALLTLILVLSSNLDAQDLEQFDKSSPINLSGNLSVGTTWIKSLNDKTIPDRLAYFINANPTINLFGFDFPFQFTYRDRQGDFSSPFNQFSFNPKYKWIQLFLGSTNLSFSKYTLSGQTIEGQGVTLSPGKFNLSFVRGHIQDPLSQIDTIVEGVDFRQTYLRQTNAAKIGYGGRKNHFNLIAFHAKDDINSRNVSPIDTTVVYPEENFVLGIQFKVTPIRFISFYADVAASAITNNQNALDIINVETDPFLNKLSDLFSINASTKYQMAGNIGVDFKIKGINLGVDLKRVDPFYKTLGTFYFQEDYENLTFKFNLPLFKSKVRINGNAGIQRNNLSELRKTTSERQIANINVVIIPSRSFSTSLRYSNFQTDRRPGLEVVNDTLRFAQTNSNYAVSPRLNYIGKKTVSVISLLANYQQLTDLSNAEVFGRNIDNYIANLGYSLKIKASHLNISTNLIYNQNKYTEREFERAGANIAISKRFLNKKLHIKTSYGQFKNFLNKADAGTSNTIGFSLNYRLQKTLSFGFNTTVFTRSEETNKRQDLRGNARITYLINTKK